MNTHTFILKEDGDSGHGPQGNNPVKQFKQKHNILHYFNAAQSPDLSIIENCWSPIKQYIDHENHLNDHTLKQHIQEAWKKLL